MKTGAAFLIAAMSGLLVSCAEQVTAEFSQADADALSEKCGAPKGWLKVHEGGEVQFQPPIEADFDVSACLFEGLKKAGVTKIGFVGNENAQEAEGE